MRGFIASLLIGRAIATGTNCRDQNVWPFANNSIWNTPIGSAAEFVPANIFQGSFPLPYNFYSDDDYFVTTSASDPLVDWYNQGWWGAPNGAAHCNVTGKLQQQVPFPENFTIEAFGENNGLALLLPDNRTLLNMQPAYRCSPGSPLLALKIGDPVVYSYDIRSNGTWGAHGGSSLSTIGGTIRIGELLPGAPPISHALKLELNAQTYYYGQKPGYLWPALNCDGYAFNASDPHRYGGSNPLLSPGSLLAIPLDASANLTLKTIPAQRIAYALTYYGGYLVDDTYENRGTLCTEHGVTDQFQAAYGFAFDAPQSQAPDWYEDMLAIFRTLQIVANNGPSSQGGGGEPLRDPPPPFCE